jgi:predicted phage baseplate assembly protein
MSWGRDVPEPDVVLVAAPVPGGLEPQLLPATRQQVRAYVASRVAAYTPEWTDRRPHDAGVALLRTHGTLAEAVHLRLNRLPRRVSLDELDLAGIRGLPASPAVATVAIQVADRATDPIEVPAGSVFSTAAGPPAPVLETTDGCTALPGRVAAVAVRGAGLLLSERPDDLGGLQPFGARPAPRAEFWVAVDTAAVPAGVLTLAVEMLLPPGRGTAEDIATAEGTPPPALRWEAVTAAGATELVVDRDGTRSLTRSGVIAFRIDTVGPWTATPPPGRPGDPPLRWLRARLVTAGFPDAARLVRVRLNGVPALAARSVRDEVAELAARQAGGRSSVYRLSQLPVLPGSVTLEVTDDEADPFGTGADGPPQFWREVATLTGAAPDARSFTLDPGAGLITFGDGVQGRAVPDGYRNVIVRVYRTGGGTAGLPAPGAALPPLRSVPGLTGATVLSITTGADAETQPGLLRRGPAAIRSQRRAVAPADYATSALDTPGVDVARAHCLPAQDPGGTGGAVGGTAPGTLGLVVVPRVPAGAGPPVPTAEALAAVAGHLARTAGIVGARVVAVGPHFRRIAVRGLLVGRPGADLATLVSDAGDRIDAWLDPITGGDGSGWPFGGTVRWDALVRVLLDGVPGLTAASRLSFRVDGRRLAPCADVPLAAGELVWPAAHVLEAVQGGSPQP